MTEIFVIAGFGALIIGIVYWIGVEMGRDFDEGE
jgi:hypothetical protein